jgi:hypothetical protein
MEDSNFFITFLILDLIGLVLNAATMVYIQSTFDIKKHVFLLIFIDASISTISAGVSSVTDAILISGYRNYPACFIMAITTYQPCSYGALLTLLIAFIRYDLAKKAAKNIISSNKKILCLPLITFIAFASSTFCYFLLCLLTEIPFAYVFDECTMLHQEPRTYSLFNTLVLQMPNLFNFTSIFVDVLLIRFIKKTVIPRSNLGAANDGECDIYPLI